MKGISPNILPRGFTPHLPCNYSAALRNGRAANAAIRRIQQKALPAGKAESMFYANLPARRLCDAQNSPRPYLPAYGSTPYMACILSRKERILEV